jgi:hypothetical protein
MPNPIIVVRVERGVKVTHTCTEPGNSFIIRRVISSSEVRCENCGAAVMVREDSDSTELVTFNINYKPPLNAPVPHR